MPTKAGIQYSMSQRATTRITFTGSPACAGDDSLRRVVVRPTIQDNNGFASARDVRDYADRIRSERQVFAAKLRIARAAAGWSQTDLANRLGLSQRAVHKLEQGETEPRRATVLAVEDVLTDAGIAFAESGQGLVMTLRPEALGPDMAAKKSARAAGRPASARRIPPRG
jgi:transcriptional regulator with XRE-family HTH domain